MYVNKRWGHLFEKQINVFSCDTCKKEFWHGLDKPLNLISDYAKENYLKDRKMDEWFIKNGLRLVRITDKQWLALCERNACNEFAKALGG